MLNKIATNKNTTLPYIEHSHLIANAILNTKANTQAPVDMIVLAVISAVSQSLQGLIDVEIPTGKIAPVSTVGISIANSGERKTAVENDVNKGIERFTDEDNKNHEMKMTEYNIKRNIHERKTAKINKSINLDDAAQCKEKVEELLAHSKNSPEKPRLSFIKFESSTSEGFLNKMNENTANACISSSEGGVVLKSRLMQNTAIINSLNSGDDVTIDTKTAGSFKLKNARLTFHIMVQPSALESFMKKSKDDVRGNGFLSRAFVCYPTSTCGTRFSQGTVFEQTSLETFNERIHHYLSKSAQLSNHQKDKQILKFNNKAKDYWFGFSNDIESKMVEGGIYQYTKDHAAKLAENAARLAALLHYFDNSSTENISVETLNEGIQLALYFSGQFISIFSSPPQSEVNIQNLHNWFTGLNSTGIRYVKRNSIMQVGPVGTRKKKDLDAALSSLQINGQIRHVKVRNTMIIDLLPNLDFCAVKYSQDIEVKIFEEL